MPNTNTEPNISLPKLPEPNFSSITAITEPNISEPKVPQSNISIPKLSEPKVPEPNTELQYKLEQV